jgi:thioredoxin 1
MKPLIAVFAIVFFSFAPDVKNTAHSVKSSNNSSHGIVFIEENWSRALAEAKKQKKLIFLDAYASWCGPCKLLKRKTFADKDAGEFFNKNFINVSVDMEKGEGPYLTEKFEVYAVPTLIIADGDGNRIAYTKGFVGPKELIEFGEYGLNKNK